MGFMVCCGCGELFEITDFIDSYYSTVVVHSCGFKNYIGGS